jgi:hypothetical protein
MLPLPPAHLLHADTVVNKGALHDEQAGPEHILVSQLKELGGGVTCQGRQDQGATHQSHRMLGDWGQLGSSMPQQEARCSDVHRPVIIFSSTSKSSQLNKV